MELGITAAHADRATEAIMTSDTKAKQVAVAFKLGGKTPTDGFDTSGFIAYILSQTQVLSGPEQFSVRRLRNKFRAPEVKAISELKPGDLVFEQNNACWFVLDDHHTIGMVPGGIMIGEPEKFSSDIAAYGRVRY